MKKPIVRRWRWFGAVVVLAGLSACGGGIGSGSKGIVAQLTGDPDGEVSADLQNLVLRAYFNPADGQPIDD